MDEINFIVGPYPDCNTAVSFICTWKMKSWVSLKGGWMWCTQDVTREHHEALLKTRRLWSVKSNVTPKGHWKRPMHLVSMVAQSRRLSLVRDSRGLISPLSSRASRFFLAAALTVNLGVPASVLRKGTVPMMTSTGTSKPFPLPVLATNWNTQYKYIL